MPAPRMFGMFFVVDPDREVSPQHLARIWQHLWEMRDLTCVSAILPAMVTSACPLLPDEATDSVLVATLAPVPENSAWVPLELDLLQYVDTRGGVRLGLLDAALRAKVERGEAGHDSTRWATAGQLQDSVLNRRLSVFVRGWGDIVALRQADPGALQTLIDLRELAEHIVAVLTEASQALAGSEGYCPALDVAGVKVLRHGREMNARWRRAVIDNALRHRNLLTMSPWDIFPRSSSADFAYVNLLPVLQCANSVSFRRDVDIRHWSIREFTRFHERISAILRRVSEAPIIAKQV